ncbi:hypothetical protein IMY05_008G0083200 [Salix suchowensis]|nr:hypothetical protein IMY05_008G0083200 [Salix suchowensis]
MDNTVEISEATCSQLVMDWHTLSFSHRSSRHITIHAYRPMKKHPFTVLSHTLKAKPKAAILLSFFPFFFYFELVSIFGAFLPTLLCVQDSTLFQGCL